MIGDLFDSPWKVAVLAVLIIVLFGYRKLPDAARSLGKSMRILKTEVQGLHEDHEEPAATTTPTAIQATPPQIQVPPAQFSAPATDAQTQIDALSKQLADLQQAVAANNGADGAQAK